MSYVRSFNDARKSRNLRCVDANFFTRSTLNLLLLVAKRRTAIINASAVIGKATRACRAIRIKMSSVFGKS